MVCDHQVAEGAVTRRGKCWSRSTSRLSGPHPLSVTHPLIATYSLSATHPSTFVPLTRCNVADGALHGRACVRVLHVHLFGQSKVSNHRLVVLVKKHVGSLHAMQWGGDAGRRGKDHTHWERRKTKQRACTITGSLFWSSSVLAACVRESHEGSWREMEQKDEGGEGKHSRKYQQ